MNRKYMFVASNLHEFIKHGMPRKMDLVLVHRRFNNNSLFVTMANRICHSLHICVKNIKILMFH